MPNDDAFNPGSMVKSQAPRWTEPSLAEQQVTRSVWHLKELAPLPNLIDVNVGMVGYNLTHEGDIWSLWLTFNKDPEHTQQYKMHTSSAITYIIIHAQ